MSTMNYLRDILTDSFDTPMDPSPTPTTTFSLPNSCFSSSSTQFSSATQEPAVSFGLDQKYNAARAHSSSDYGFEQSSQLQYPSFQYQQPRTSAALNSNESPLAPSSCSLSNEASASTSFQLPCVSDADTNLPITTAATITDIPFSFYNNSLTATDTNSTEHGSGSKVSTTFSPQSSKWLTNEDPLDLSDVFDEFEYVGLKKGIIPMPIIGPQRSSGLYLNNKRVSKTKPKTITVVDLTNDDAEHTYEVSVTDSGSSPSNATSTNARAGSVNHQADLLAPPLENDATPAAQSVDITISESSPPFYSCQEESGQAVGIEPSFGVPAPSSSASQTFSSTSSPFDTTSSSSSIVNTPPKLRIRTKTELFEQTQPASLMDMIDAYLPSRAATTLSQGQNAAAAAAAADQILISNNQSTVQPSNSTPFEYFWPARHSTTNSYPQTTTSGLQSSQISTTSSVANTMYGGETTAAQPTYSGRDVPFAPTHLLNPGLLPASSANLPSRTLPRRRIWEKPYVTSPNVPQRKTKSKQSGALAATAHTATATTSTYLPQDFYPAATAGRTNIDPASSSPSFQLGSLWSSSSSSSPSPLPSSNTNSNSSSNLNLAFSPCSRLSCSSFMKPRYSDPNVPSLSKSLPPRVRCLEPNRLYASAPVANATFSNHSTGPCVRPSFPAFVSSTSLYSGNACPPQSFSVRASQDLSFTPSLTNAVPSAIASPNQNFTIYANKVNIQNAAGQETASMTTAVKKQTSSNTLPGKTDNDDDGECVVCLERSASMVLYKCGHACLCEVCVVKVKQEGSKCPICRNVFKDAIKLYKV